MSGKDEGCRVGLVEIEFDLWVTCGVCKPGGAFEPRSALWFRRRERLPFVPPPGLAVEFCSCCDPFEFTEVYYSVLDGVWHAYGGFDDWVGLPDAAIRHFENSGWSEIRELREEYPAGGGEGSLPPV